jgi:Cation efflux family
MVGKRSLTNFDKADAPSAGDIEHGLRKPKFARFRDVVDMATAQNQRTKVKKQLTEGIDRMGLEAYRKSEAELKDIKNKQVRRFYETQNDRLNDWLEVDTLVMSMAEDILESMNPDRDRDGVPEQNGALQGVGERIQELLPKEARDKGLQSEKHARWAINVSQPPDHSDTIFLLTVLEQVNVMANVLLLIAKCIAAFHSSSLSLIASLVDSALDLLCTLIVWSTNRLVQWRINRLSRRFPVGRRRLEPIGVLVFSVIMVIAFMQVLKESVEKLLPGGEKEAAELPLIAVGAMLATVIVKGIIWVGCARIKTTQVQALAQGEYITHWTPYVSVRSVTLTDTF